VIFFLKKKEEKEEKEEMLYNLDDAQISVFFNQMRRVN
jgi:hypothetical protein